MKISHETYKNAIRHVNVSQDINQNLLRKNKDTDYELWLVKREKKEERKNAVFWFVFSAIILFSAICIFVCIIKYQGFFKRLEQEGTCITAEYYDGSRAYKYYENGKSKCAYCTKSILYKNQGETAQMYYIGNDFAQAVPLPADWVWIVVYFIVIIITGICAFSMVRQVKRITKNKE